MTKPKKKVAKKISEKDALKSMRELVEYMAPDEERHYEECLINGESIDTHIYIHVMKVAEYLAQKGVK